MKIKLTGGLVYKDGGFFSSDIVVDDAIISHENSSGSDLHFDYCFDVSGLYILPGFADVHVHLREPGFSYKETIASGTAAAARGGFTALCTMPNLSPPPDSLENLALQTNIINRNAVVKVTPFACITKDRGGKELVDFSKLAPFVAGFSDDGSPVESDQIMLRAMDAIYKINRDLPAKEQRRLSAHCEDIKLVKGGYIHDGRYAKTHGHKGISSKSEWVQIERDIQLVEKTGCPYHVCHISTREGVELVRAAKSRGLPVTCETAPHYLSFCEDDLLEHGRYKMNPPLRSKADRAALIAGVCDGTIDVIATDHAPHSELEKSKGLQGSMMGVVGLECAFSAVYTALVKTGLITLERLCEIMSVRPRELFGLDKGELVPGAAANFTVVDINKRRVIDSSDFLSKGKSTPYLGTELYGDTVMTYAYGRMIWKALEEN